MRKIILFLALIIIISVENVLAQDQYKLTLEKQSGIYFSRHGENFKDDSFPFYLYKFGDIYAYCIEPGKHISTYTYIGSDEYVDLNFSEEVKEKLELIGYYGRDYPGHDNIRYSMATQALIWELTGVDQVTYWTKQNEGGDEINVDNERNEIMRLVNNHKTLPSFKVNYDAYLNQELKIIDNNNVLEHYEVINNDVGDVSIIDNVLCILPKKIGIFNIELNRKDYDEYKTIIFVGKGDNSSQKMARLHFTKEVKTNFNVNVKGIRLVVQKVDENNNPIKISNIKFKIHDLTRGVDICDNVSNCIQTTNDGGIFISPPLTYGEYEIEEIDQFIPGYSWNKDKLRVKIDDKIEFNYDERIHNYLNLTFTNHSVLGAIEIKKIGQEAIFIDNNLSYQEINLGNIEFELYHDDNYIKTVMTDNLGYVKVDNLKIGKYYLIEKTKLDGYLEKERIPFEIKQDNQYQHEIKVNLEIKNYLKKGDLEFSKEDLVTSEGISNTIIEIYDSNDKLLLTRVTDEFGKVKVNELPIGKYYIIEKEANSLYQLTNEKVFFEIKENGEIIKAKMLNEKIEIPVPKTNTNEGIISNSFFAIVFIIGVGRMIYEKKMSY